jgi:ribosomal protein L37AE/L43A
MQIKHLQFFHGTFAVDGGVLNHLQFFSHNLELLAMNVKEYVESLGLQNDESRRMDCPSCGHKKTFSVTNQGGTLMWNCFYADCGVKGRTGLRITRSNSDNVVAILSKNNQEKTPSCSEVPFVKPKSWSRVIPSRGMDYVHLVNTSGRYDDIYFDVIRDRLVYPIYDTLGSLRDGVGRTMTGEKPKWYRYGNYAGGFRIGTSDIAIVVEDVPSAVSISDWVSGYALLGTSLRDRHIQELSAYRRVIFALDKDATDKALTMMRALHNIVPTGMLILDKDLETRR